MESECRASSRDKKEAGKPRARSPNAGLFRTKEAGKPREESECRASSDKGSRKTERGVRMQGYFRQRKQENRERSPSTGLVQTSEAKRPREESECRAIWTKEAGKPREESPNAGLVRTKEAEKPRVESEYRASSDK